MCYEIRTTRWMTDWLIVSVLNWKLDKSRIRADSTSNGETRRFRKGPEIKSRKRPIVVRVEFQHPSAWNTYSAGADDSHGEKFIIWLEKSIIYSRPAMKGTVITMCVLVFHRVSQKRPRPYAFDRSKNVKRENFTDAAATVAELLTSLNVGQIPFFRFVFVFKY